MKSITASDANRQFSRILQQVRAGEEITVTSRGKPVARIAPVRANKEQGRAARQRLLERLRQQAIRGTRDWSRDELYD